MRRTVKVSDRIQWPIKRAFDRVKFSRRGVRGIKGPKRNTFHDHSRGSLPQIYVYAHQQREFTHVLAWVRKEKRRKLILNLIQTNDATMRVLCLRGGWHGAAATGGYYYQFYFIAPGSWMKASWFEKRGARAFKRESSAAWAHYKLVCISAYFVYVYSVCMCTLDDGCPPASAARGKVKGHYVCVLFQVLESNIAFSLRLAVAHWRDAVSQAILFTQ